MVRLPHQHEDEPSDTADDEDAAGSEEEDEEQDHEDPVHAIFRIIEEYYEGIHKREDEGMGVG